MIRQRSRISRRKRFEVASHPSRTGEDIGIGCRQPDVRTSKVRSVGIGIGHALNDGEPAVIKGVTEAGHGRMPSKIIRKAQRTALWNSDRWTVRVILVDRDRHDGIQAIITTSHLDQHQNSVTGTQQAIECVIAMSKSTHGERINDARKRGQGDAGLTGLREKSTTIHALRPHINWYSGIRTMACISPRIRTAAPGVSMSHS